MNYLDIFIAVTLIVAIVLGYKDGFIRKIIATVGFFLAIYLAVVFAENAGLLINSVTGIEMYFARIIGGFLIFILVVFLASFISRLVKPFDRINAFINRILGALIGLLQFLFFLSALFFILNVFGFPPKEVKSDSYLYEGVYNVIPATIKYIKDYSPETRRYFENPLD